MNSQAPKKRGRPAKSKVAPTAVSVSEKSPTKSPPKTKSPMSSPNGEAAKSPVKPPTEVKPPIVKKGRGRPKGTTAIKNSSPKKATERSALSTKGGGVTKKGAVGKRGRPKKKNAVTSEESSGEQSDAVILILAESLLSLSFKFFSCTRTPITNLHKRSRPFKIFFWSLCLGYLNKKLSPSITLLMSVLGVLFIFGPFLNPKSCLLIKLQPSFFKLNMIRRPLSSLKLKQTDIEEMDANMCRVYIVKGKNVLKERGEPFHFFFFLLKIIFLKMTDMEEDPYAVSSDSDDENAKKPPPKIAIEGRTGDLKQIKEALKGDEKKSTKDEKMLEEIEALRREKAEEMSRMKRDFEEGRAGGIAQIQKESLEGVGKENLASMKEMFEKEPGKEFISQKDDLFSELQHKSGDSKKIKNNFERTSEDEEKQKDCCICLKVVYPVEKIWVGKQLYHTQCFKCSKCGKKLSQNAFNSHKGILYCKPHMLEILHPERVGQFAAEELEDQKMDNDDDDGEFVVSSKPKQLSSDVIRAGGVNIGDELAQLKSSLKDKKESWQSSAIAGAQTSAVDEEEKRRQLEEIKGSVGIFLTKKREKGKRKVNEVKQKWKTGDIEGANLTEDGAKQEELEALKKGINVKERFQPPTSGGDVQKCYDRSELDTSAISDARKSFIEGSVYASPKTESSAAGELNELKFTEMNAFKDKFEKGKGDIEEIEKAKIELDLQLKELKKAFEKPESEMSPEERAEKKKVEIEAEFARYKLARKLQAKKAREEEGGGEGGGGGEEGQEGGEKELDVQIKLAGKAREKFKQIEAQGQAGIPQPGIGITQQKTPSKWDKKVEGGPVEVVNSEIKTRRRRRFGRDGRRIRCEEFDGKIQEYSYDNDGTKREGKEFGGIGSFEIRSEEFEGTIRKDESNGIERDERREEKTIGGGIQTTQRRKSKSPKTIRRRTIRSSSFYKQYRERRRSNSRSSCFEDGSQMGENSQEGSEESREITNASEINFCSRGTSPICIFPYSSPLPKKLMDNNNKISPVSAIRLFSAFLTGLAIGLMLVPRIFGR
ncbi:LIM zinc-binding domain-containing protein [Meloidogyne graminicola]|uniref:LIM zinc-binding domain-containing protein n=1 Tax=Meloidogyne graminicola TaxID=189291 RepID=A0A8T0A1E6_9BILA|nr:LIM zinc-binding domain-containing protein [Meloidogyne graminicola]